MYRKEFSKKSNDKFGSQQSFNQGGRRGGHGGGRGRGRGGSGYDQGFSRPQTSSGYQAGPGLFSNVSQSSSRFNAHDESPGQYNKYQKPK